MTFIINIPKNASSYISEWTEHFGWHAGSAIDHEKRISEMIVVLRDPLDRWISGISQYLCGYVLHAKNFYDAATGPDQEDQYIDANKFLDHYNTALERILFDNLERHDDHVWPQNEIIQGVLPDKRKVYYYLDDTFEAKLSKHLGIPVMTGIDRNQGSNNPDQKILQMFFRDRIKERPNLKEMIINRYQKDYELIDQVISCR